MVRRHSIEEIWPHHPDARLSFRLLVVFKLVVFKQPRIAQVHIRSVILMSMDRQLKRCVIEQATNLGKEVPHLDPVFNCGKCTFRRSGPLKGIPVCICLL